MSTTPHEPDVSVVIPVYNAMPFLTECLQSIARQTLSVDRIEVVAVDDGSTDGSGEELDRWAREHPWVRVVHQQSSGGPSRPRNRALDLARGRYVYFVDADDWLGDEALERMVGMADRCGSDVVVGKFVGVCGRNAGSRAFRRTLDRADLFTSDVYRTLNALKMFRRQLIEQHSIRFPEDMWYGEDQIFTASAYFEARTISVLADYDCYFWRSRNDGGHVSDRNRTVDEAMQGFERLVGLVAARFPQGPQRDALMLRHLRNNLDKVLRWGMGQQDEGVLRQVMERSREIVRRYGNDAMYRQFPVLHRVRVRCVLDDDLGTLLQLMQTAMSDDPDFVIEGTSVYADLPGFRDPSRNIPDSWFDVTHQSGARATCRSVSWQPGGSLRVVGDARIRHVDPSRTSLEVVLRRRDSGTEVVHPVSRPGAVVDDGAPRDSFVIDVPLTMDGAGTLEDGIWDAFVRLTAGDLVREARLRFESGQEPGARAWPMVLGGPQEEALVVAYATKGDFVAIDAGGRYHPYAGHAVLLGAGWSGSRLEVTGRAWIDDPEAPEATTSLVLRRRDEQQQFAVPVSLLPAAAADRGGDGAELEARGSFQAHLDLATVADGRPLSPGVWDLFVRLDGPGGVVREVRFGRRRSVDSVLTLDPQEIRVGAATLPVGLYITKYDNISLRVRALTEPEPTSAPVDGDATAASHPTTGRSVRSRLRSLALRGPRG